MVRLSPAPISPRIVPSLPLVPIIGAVFGGITLLALLCLVLLAGNNPHFICNSFTLIASAFSLGAALAAGFIGGAAAFQGQFGETGKSNAVAITAGGGIAVLFCTFFIFNQFGPSNCPQVVEIENLNRQITQLELELSSYKNQDMRITPQSSNQARSLKDRIEIKYSNRDRADISAQPKGGAFVIPRQDFDEGSAISIGTRDNAEVARPGADPQLAGSRAEPTKIILSSIRYRPLPLELQLFLNIGDR